MFGSVTYIPRSEYANRSQMLAKYCQHLHLNMPSTKIHVIQEGAAEPLALLGLIRLVEWLAQSCTISSEEPCSLIVDSGTGTTATGLAIGIKALQLPWQVIGVMLAGDTSYYSSQALQLFQNWLTEFPGSGMSDSDLPIQWVQRCQPRKFGRTSKVEIEKCASLAKRHGVLLDPIYSLAAWEVAEELAGGASLERLGFDSKLQTGQVVMLHTGGSLGLHGLAQRFPESF